MIATKKTERMLDISQLTILRLKVIGIHRQFQIHLISLVYGYFFETLNRSLKETVNKLFIKYVKLATSVNLVHQKDCKYQYKGNVVYCCSSVINRLSKINPGTKLKHINLDRWNNGTTETMICNKMNASIHIKD